MNFIKKTSIWLIIFSLAVPADPAWAIPASPTAALNDIMTDLGVDKEELKKNISNTLDVANIKKNPPSVTLTFVPENPIPGKEVTAIATPANFTGNPEQMYFIWFLKHNSEGGDDGKGNINWDERGSNPDIEDFKIEAMRIMARGNTEEFFDYSSGDDDNDGYAASFGGDDQKGKPAHCYVRDISTGVDYEIGVPNPDPDKPTIMRCEHVFPKSDEGEMVGGPDNAFGIDDEEFWGTDPHSDDTNNDGVSDEKALTGLGMLSFTWIYQDGDQVGVTAEGVQENTDYTDSSYKTMWGFSKNTCEIEPPVVNTPSQDERNVYKFDHHSCDYPDRVTITIDCVNKEGVETIEPFNNPVTYNVPSSDNNCGDSTDKIGDPHCSGLAFLPCTAIPPGGNGCGRCYFDLTTFSLWKGGGENDHQLAIILPESYGDYACDVCLYNASDATETYYYPIGCNDDGDPSNCEIIRDPGDPEPVECGPFKGKLNWEELPRDSSDTDINECLEDNFVDPAQGTADKNIEISLSYSPQYPINDPRGQIEDSENNSDELKIIASLSNIEDRSFVKYDWKFWLCDENGSKCVPRINKEPLPGGMSPAQLRDNFGLSKTSGMGIDSVLMKLMVGNDEALDFANHKYLKAEVRAIETTSNTQGKSGRKAILIPLQENEEDIVPVSVTVEEDALADIGLRLEQEGPDGREDRYENILESCPDKTCPVVKNEIIGLYFNGEIDDKVLSWYLNGKPLATSGENSNEAYFPVMDGAGSKYSVRLDIGEKSGSAENEMTKDKVTLARTFSVEDPKVTLHPDCPEDQPNCFQSVPLGTFIDPTDPSVRQDDFSEDLFQAEEASEIVIEPIFNFENSILRNIDGNNDPNDNTWKIQWFVDGEAVVPSSATSFPHVDPLNGNLILPINKISGESYQVKAEALYNQSELNKRALHRIWNNPVNYFYSSTVSDSLEIKVIENDGIAVRSGSEKVLASIFSAMPSYVNFLFRTILTLALVLFLANLSLIVFPKQRI